MKSTVSKAKRVQVFKWLLRKHRCSILLEKESVEKDKNKMLMHVVYLCSQDNGKSFTLDHMLSYFHSRVMCLMLTYWTSS